VQGLAPSNGPGQAEWLPGNPGHPGVTVSLDDVMAF
jgi:hypothetical protein